MGFLCVCLCVLLNSHVCLCVHMSLFVFVCFFRFIYVCLLVNLNVSLHKYIVGRLHYPNVLI